MRALAGIGFLVALAGCEACRETFEERYPTVKAAEQAGAIQRGWIPHWIPPSATDIAEVHNVDTNYRLLAFSYDSYATDTFLKACSPLDPKNVTLPIWAPVKWWPEELRHGSVAPGHLKLFSCGDTDREFLAIDEKAKRAFGWQTPY